MTLLGLAGGIGSGKSYIAHLLSTNLGIPVYDSDSHAKQLNNTDPFIRKGLTQMAGPQVYGADGQLQRHVLAHYIFSDPSHAAQVNALVHPAVWADFQQWAATQHSPIVALESGILFESGFASHMHRILLVDAPTEVRVARAMQRDKATREQILARIAQQHTAQYLDQCDWVITNHQATDQQLLQQLASIKEQIETQHI